MFVTAQWEGVTEVTARGLLIGGKTQLNIVTDKDFQSKRLQSSFYSDLLDYFLQEESESKQVNDGNPIKSSQFSRTNTRPTCAVRFRIKPKHGRRSSCFNDYVMSKYSQFHNF